MDSEAVSQAGGPGSFVDSPTCPHHRRRLRVPQGLKALQEVAEKWVGPWKLDVKDSHSHGLLFPLNSEESVCGT